jgi:hypothetical protein
VKEKKETPRWNETIDTKSIVWRPGSHQVIKEDKHDIDTKSMSCLL